jgi:aminocarboxymuconate-semialdehyde decarboxylase
VIADTMPVDIHTHFFPPGLPDFAARTGDPRWPHLVVEDDSTGRIMRGDELFRVVSRPCWDVASRLADMDETGVATQVLSPVPVTLTTWAEPEDAALFARLQNDLLAEAVSASNGRLLGLGTVPLQDVDAAITELHRIAGLGLRGVEIGTEVGGRELDDPGLRPFFEAAEGSATPLFIHPTDGGGAIRRSAPLVEFAVGMLTDTALAAAALVFGGVVEAFPDLRLGLAHGCGAFPWTYPRLRFAAAAGGQDPKHLDELVRTLWVDSLVFDSAHLPLLFRRFGSEHVMLGSDYPFLPRTLGAPEDVVLSAVAHGTCTHDDAHAVLAHNARRFLDNGSEVTP